MKIKINKNKQYTESEIQKLVTGQMKYQLVHEKEYSYWLVWDNDDYVPLQYVAE